MQSIDYAAENARKAAVAEALRGLTEDFKASVVAAEIAANGFPAEAIFFRNQSTFRRPYSKDIEHVFWSETDDGDSRLVFELNREGIYDMLPEAVAHNQARRSSADATRLGNELRREEREARTFFSPLENEFHCRLLNLDKMERSLLRNNDAAKAREFFHYFFEDASALSDAQLLVLLYILPLSNKIRNDLPLIGITLTRIIGLPVSVVPQWVAGAHRVKDGTLPRLGAGRLGIDTIMGEVCTVPELRYDIHIRDIAPGDYHHYTGSGKMQNVLRFMLPYFFSASAVYRIELHCTDERAALVAAGDDSWSFLGFNSYI